jgi:hypothetical protein
MKVMVIASLLLTACASTTPVVLKSPPRGPGTPEGWIKVSLTIVGDTPGFGSSDGCTEMATKVGIELVEGAPRAGTLTFGEQDKNYFEMPGAPRQPIEALNPTSACTIALGRLVEIDKLVTIAKADPPATCEMVGHVQGEDKGWLGNGSLEVATIGAQLAVRKQGGNRFVLDMGTEDKRDRSSEASDVRVGGRAYRCAP